MDGLTGVAFGNSGVTADDTEVISATEAVAHITIDGSAAQGVCDVTVLTGDKRVACDDTFMVEEEVKAMN